MLNELKEAPLIWRLVAFIGIPLAAIFACIAIASAGYVLMGPSTDQAQPANQDIVAEVPPPIIPAASETPIIVLPATETIPTPTLPLPTATPTLPAATPTPLPSEASYELNWKIEEGQPIAYNTAMEASECCTSVDYDRIFNFGRSGEGSDMSSGFKEMFENLQKNQPSYSMVSILEKQPEGNISVRMVLDKVELPEQGGNDLGQGFGQMLKGMEGTPLLQGEVTTEGEIASPYLAQQQKNLLALFFELPVGPVKIGDTWEIDLTCIALNSAQFKVENSERLNQVTLKEITETPEGEPLAIVDYLIAESIEGQQTMPFSSNEPVSTTMKCSFLGRGEFLLEQGRWQAFSAEYTVKSTGVVTADVTQQLALTPLAEVPEYPEPALQNQPSLSESLSKSQETRTCWYKSEEIIGPDAEGSMTISSYLPAGEQLETSTRAAVLQLVNLESPEELTLNGEKFVQNPYEKMAGGPTSLPIDASQISEPVISLILTSDGEAVEDSIKLNFGNKDYLLRLDEETVEYCRK